MLYDASCIMCRTLHALTTLHAVGLPQSRVPGGSAANVAKGIAGLAALRGPAGQRRTSPACAFIGKVGDAEGSLGDAKSSLGDAKRSLGDAKSSQGDAG
jgi:hypothetical protein